MYEKESKEVLRITLNRAMKQREENKPKGATMNTIYSMAIVISIYYMLVN